MSETGEDKPLSLQMDEQPVSWASDGSADAQPFSNAPSGPLSQGSPALYRPSQLDLNTLLVSDSPLQYPPWRNRVSMCFSLDRASYVEVGSGRMS